MPHDVPPAACQAEPAAAAPVRRLPACGALLLALTTAAWSVLVWLAFDMGHPLARLTMPGSAQWSATNLLAVWLMWSVMMAAMMLPSALPMVLVFARLGGRGGDRRRGPAFVAAYLAVWAGFSLAATAAQWVLQATGRIDPMIVSVSPLLTAALLLVAGVYQFSPLKRVCLSHCRTPFGFLLGGWRPGATGAFAMGLRHGLQCLGCCWALMALLFVGGAMNLAWVAALTVAVAAEKLLPGGARLAAALGMVLVGAGAFRLLSLLAGG